MLVRSFNCSKLRLAGEPIFFISQIQSQEAFEDSLFVRLNIWQTVYTVNHILSGVLFLPGIRLGYEARVGTECVLVRWQKMLVGYY